MPISSGAEGHVGVGVNRSIKWIPEGGEDNEGVRISNSYLQRYLYHTGGRKIKPEEKSEWSSDTDGKRNTQKKQAQESSNIHPTEQKRKKTDKIQDGKAQDSSLKENPSTTNTQENSTKATKEDSSTAPSQNPMTSTTEPIKKDTAAANGPAKKSSVCLIL